MYEVVLLLSQALSDSTPIEAAMFLVADRATSSLFAGSQLPSTQGSFVHLYMSRPLILWLRAQESDTTISGWQRTWALQKE